MSNDLAFKSLGLCDYQETLDAMKSHLGSEQFHDEIWFVEHPPVFTLGTAADKSHILNAKNIPIIQTDRGGEVTYHGPGQLVIYFMLDIKRLELGPKSLVQSIQNFTKNLLNEFSIESNFIAGAPGVYVEDKKIASIGLRISKGKSYHGISINVDMDLDACKINFVTFNSIAFCHAVGALLCVPYTVGWPGVSRDTALILLRHGALAEVGWEISDTLERAYNGLFVEGGTASSPLPLCLMLFFHHFTACGLVIPFNLWYA